MNNSQFKHITLQQLEILVNIIEQGSFSRAGEKLMLTQPSISKHIKNLEIFIDAPIIDRSLPGLALTEQGKILYSYAKKILNLRDEARLKVEAIETSGQKKLFIAASTIPAAYMLPKIIGSFRISFPSTMLHVLTGDSSEVIEMTCDSRAEIGFIGKPANDKKLSCEPVWDDTLILAFNPKIMVSIPDSITIKDLSNLPIIGREQGSGTRTIIEDRLTEISPGLKLNTICELGSSEAVKEALIAGAGAAIISVHAIKRELASGILKEAQVKGLTIKRSFNMIYPKDFKLLSLHRKFMEFARKADI
jgi:DNA-binding transcriptional LysR family regulator